ncbi:MAG: SDR family NAD(P)-dependent oxidoreductase [Dehalococcoidia bacterium]
MTTLVVGADGGIGRAVTRLLQSQGEEVVGLDRASGVNATDPEQVESFLLAHPPVGKIVHVAGTVNKGTVDEHTIADWHRIIDDNLTSVFVVVRAALPSLRRAGGAIVLTSSTAGRNGGNRLTGVAYAAAKGGVLNLTRHLAAELAADGIRVNCVAPGLVDTPMLDPLSAEEKRTFAEKTPIPRLIPPEEIAAAMVFLLSPAAASITGAVLDVNGGRWMG